MLNQAIINTALRFGIAYAGLSGLLLTLSWLMGINPFGPFRLWSLCLLPVFILMGLRYIRQFEVANELPYTSAFRVGSTISFLGGGCSAMLLYLYTIVSGQKLLDRHKTDMRQMLEQSQMQLDQVFGKESMKRAIEQIDLITPASLAFDDFFWKIVLGFVASFILAFFFRQKTDVTEQ